MAWKGCAGLSSSAMIVCLTIVGTIACQFHHPASSDPEHGHKMPIGHHQDGHSDSVFCLTATLPEDLVLVELTFVSWVSIPIRLHATLLAKQEE
jgi:hypothetical protein